ncbi:MAG: MerR family transcriptional regulator, partial [Lachnospiraceae bacterium]|nr:MerR family transcriptional regulator [Lachnospiraceae bacterium]
MKKEGFYSSGKFAAMAHVTKKTLRYYDDNNILKPSIVTENGTKYYSDNDFAKLQQIIFLKYLSFPLTDIKELTV